VAVFLERQLKIVHLDIKTSNLMYDQDKELILIDLGLVETIKHGHEIYVPEKKYFIWPYDSCYLVTIPVYSIAICVMEFFFGKLKVWQIQSLEEVKEYIDNISRRSKSLGNILYKMVSLKYDPSTVLKYIEIKYKSDLEILDKDLDIQNITASKNKSNIKKRSLNKWFHTLIQDVHEPPQPPEK
jgi:serine/threonine protein kinase